jgi:hypothetical protein
MQLGTERTEKVLFFHRHILPLLNKSARDFWTQVQHERAKDPEKYPFAVDCVNVLRDCAADLRFFPPIKSDHWSDNECVFALNTTGDERKKCAELLKHFGFMDKER